MKQELLEFVPATEQILQAHIAEWLHTERTWRHMSLRALGRKSGVDEKTLRRIEAADPKHKSYDPTYKIVPSLTTLMKICNAFEIPIANIFIKQIAYVYI